MQNLIINNIYIFVSITSINLIILLNICTYSINIVFELNTFVAIFFSILYCYLNNIFYNRLDIKNIIKFTIYLFFIIVANIINSFNARSFSNFLYTFNIYIFIAFNFILYLTIK